MDARAEQLVLDYLRRLEDAARSRLGAAERMAFMARSRVAVAREIGETRADGADDVRRLLHRFGDPDRLAARERQRLDRVGGPAAAAEDGNGQAGPGHDDSGQDAAERAGPGHDGLGHDGYGHDGHGHDGTARRGTAHDGTARHGTAHDGQGPRGVAAAGSGQGGSGQGGSGQGGSGQGGSGQGGSGQSGARRNGSQSAAATAQERRPGAAPALHRPMTARWRPGQRPDQAAAPDGAAGPAPGLPLVSRWPRTVARPAPAGAPGSAAIPGPGRDNEQVPADGGWEPAAGEPDTPGPGWLGGLLAVVRRHPLECVAILLIGLGGLIAPWPLWPVGALAMIASPLWGVRDKLAAVAIPLGFALAGAITLAGFSAHPPGLSGYAHEVHVEGWSLLRAGAVLGAAYLARRLQRGRRPRREPPWRRVPPAGR